MCDWDEADYAEYLLWVRAAQATAPSPTTISRLEKNRWKPAEEVPAQDAVEA